MGEPGTSRPVAYSQALIVVAPTVLLALLTFVGLYLSLMFADRPFARGIDPSVVFTGIAAIGLVAVAAGVRLLSGRAGSAAALAMTGWIPPSFLLAWGWLNGATDITFLASVSVAPLFVVLWLFFSPFVLRAERPLGRLARVLGPVAVLAVLALCGAAHLRSRELPSPDRWAASLPSVKKLRVGETARLPGGTLTYTKGETGSYCELVTMDDPLSDAGGHDGGAVPCDGLDLRRDERVRLWVIFDAAGNERRTLRDDLRSVHHPPRAIAASVAPPPGWISGAAFGLLPAIVAITFGELLRRAAARAPTTDGSRDVLDARARGCSFTALVVVSLSAAQLVSAAVARLVL